VEDNTCYERDDFQADSYEDEQADPYNLGYQAGMKGEARKSDNSMTVLSGLGVGKMVGVTSGIVRRLKGFVIEAWG